VTIGNPIAGAELPQAGALDVLAVGAHPDDVELGCGGTLALLAASGRATGIVHLTSGEAGSRGSAEERRREAARAAEALGIATLEILDCGDGGLRADRAEEDALIEVLRRLRPRLVLGPPPADRHPDHGRAHALTRAACFYAGLAKRSAERGAPHRPAALFCYLQHDLATPTFVVDVTTAWPRKMAALDAYRSQLWPEPSSAQTSSLAEEVLSNASGASTLVSSHEFRLSIEGRARHLGIAIGAAYGEGFLALGPLAVADPLDLVPRGLR
jgi:bacillithiol biosynthesis deacetylase BshB1